MTSIVSRRRLLKSAGALASAGVLLEPGEKSGTFSVDGGRPRALALIGDRYHNADYIRVALNRLFRELNLPIDYTINYDDISPRLLRPYRLFLVLRDGMIWPQGYLEPNDYEYSHPLENSRDFPREKFESWITEEQGAAIKDFVEAGDALHNSSHISLSCKSYREVMGGAYIDHPALRPFKVSVVNEQHPITQGVQDFMVNDEQHFVTYDKDPQYILLRSENIDGLTEIFEGKDLGPKAIAGWAYVRQGPRGLHRRRPYTACYVTTRIFQGAKERNTVAVKDGIAVRPIHIEWPAASRRRENEASNLVEGHPRCRGHCCRRLSGGSRTFHPIAVDLAVDPAREKEMLRNFETIFRPEAVRHQGYIDVKMLKLRTALQGSSPADLNYRFSLTYRSEELRQK